MKKVGLLGGTFDPPHLGHLTIAKTVYEKLNLDEIWFVPTYEPPHKRSAEASPKHRLEMLKLLIKDYDHFSVSTVEFELKGQSYTIDTVKHLKEKHPNNEFYFIIGGDMIDYLPNWYKIDELFKLIQFVGVKRKGYQINEHPHVLIVDMELVNISSTEIRNEIKNNHTPNGLPEHIVKYIRENHLYEN